MDGGSKRKYQLLSHNQVKMNKDQQEYYRALQKGTYKGSTLGSHRLPEKERTRQTSVKATPRNNTVQDKMKQNKTRKLQETITKVQDKYAEQQNKIHKK